jgi:hypothetical protein
MFSQLWPRSTLSISMWGWKPRCTSPSRPKQASPPGWDSLTRESWSLDCLDATNVDRILAEIIIAGCCGHLLQRRSRPDLLRGYQKPILSSRPKLKRSFNKKRLHQFQYIDRTSPVASIFIISTGASPIGVSSNMATAQPVVVSLADLKAGEAASMIDESLATDSA